MKTFVLDLSRVSNGVWYCGHKACTMGQFAEQECVLPKGFDKMNDSNKAITADVLCNKTLGREASSKIISINDGKGTCKSRVEKMRKIFNKAGWRLVVKGKR